MSGTVNEIQERAARIEMVNIPLLTTQQCARQERHSRQV